MYSKAGGACKKIGQFIYQLQNIPYVLRLNYVAHYYIHAFLYVEITEINCPKDIINKSGKLKTPTEIETL
jgi:hypothetical protein